MRNIMIIADHYRSGDETYLDTSMLPSLQHLTIWLPWEQLSCDEIKKEDQAAIVLCGDDYVKDCQYAHVLLENLEKCLQNFAIKMACSVPPPKFTVLLKGESLSGGDAVRSKS